MNDNHSESEDMGEMRHFPPEVSDETTLYQLPDSTVRVLQRETVDVYISSATDGDGYRVMITHPYEFGASLAGILDEEMCPQPDEIGIHLDWGAYQVFALAEISEIRDGYECVRDHIRHGEGQPRIEPDTDALQEMIDALVVIERAVAHSRSRDEDDRVRHYQRINALGEDAEEVITTVQQAVEQQSEPTGILDRIRKVGSP